MSATLCDIKNLDFALINQDDVFAIDTNVLLWTHYSKASNPHLKTHPYQVTEYPNFIAKLLANERLSYRNEIDHILNEIKSSYNDQIEVIEITKENLESFCQEIDQTKCDIFDYIVIEYLKSINIINYISDDKDFLDVDGINLYTTYDT